MATALVKSSSSWLIPAWAGKTPWAPFGPGAPGLIPAWAGKTSADEAAAEADPAHPRVGGENARGRE